MAEYVKLAQPIVGAGLDLSVPIDRLDDGKLAVADNIRSYTRRQVEGRPGVGVVNATPLDLLSIHTIRRLNDPLASASQAFARVVGSGSKLYTDDATHLVYTSCATGFSGDPLQLVPHRPNQSVEAWMYVANSLKSGKVNVAGTF